jgi:hypothetical protein
MSIVYYYNKKKQSFVAAFSFTTMMARSSSLVPYRDRRGAYTFRAPTLITALTTKAIPNERATENSLSKKACRKRKVVKPNSPITRPRRVATAASLP